MDNKYFNSAITGNSRILACLNHRGELIRLFWPSIDFAQQLEKFTVGIFNIAGRSNTLWLNDNLWDVTQSYLGDTNIIRTTYESSQVDLKISQLDYCLIDEDVLIRQYEITNTGPKCISPGIICYSRGLGWTYNPAGVLFDFDMDSLVHYSHDCYLSISGSKRVFKFQLGASALECANHAVLNGINDIGMMQDGAVSWELGPIEPNETMIFAIYMSMAHELNQIGKKLTHLRKKAAEQLLQDVKNYWNSYIDNCKTVTTGIKLYDDLYKRSLLVFKLMSNQETGGIIAAPEIDEYFSKCGRYGYCWGRDAAFITGALDRCGLEYLVDKFFYWAIKTQDPNGAWKQRYYTDGNLAPSWGLQIDETGSLVWGMLQHYRITKSRTFLLEMWNSVEKAVNFLVDFIDPDTGLPGPGYDIWEERYGEHIYSSAAVYAGIKAGVEIALILGKDKSVAERWDHAAERIKNAVSDIFWKEEHDSFIRSVKVKLNPWGSEFSNDTLNVRVNPKGDCLQVTREDWTVDASILGVCIPFQMFDARDGRVKRSIEKLERVLSSPGGGLFRYERDNYIGGNPWVLTTLWIALYYIREENTKRALECFDWVAKSATPSGLLPEQVDKHSGKPAWVIPLTWSHAMFVLVLFELLEAGCFG